MRLITELKEQIFQLDGNAQINIEDAEVSSLVETLTSDDTLSLHDGSEINMSDMQTKRLCDIYAHLIITLVESLEDSRPVVDYFEKQEKRAKLQESLWQIAKIAVGVYIGYKMAQPKSKNGN